MARPISRTLKVTRVNPRQTTSKRNHYVTCETDAGKVAFWGSDENLRNIQMIEKSPLPVTVTCGCIPSNWNEHDLWVPQNEDMVESSSAQVMTQ